MISLQGLNRWMTVIELFFFTGTGFGQSNELADPVEFLSRLIQKESITENEKNAGYYLLDYCKRVGLYTRVFSDSDSGFNFCASIYPLKNNKPNIVFLSHLDVVPAGNADNWTYPPFSGAISNGYVWGRGAIDCKGLIVMQLSSIFQFIAKARETNLPYNITFLSVSGEEGIRNNGSKYIVSHFLKELNPVAIFGEGGSGFTNFIPSEPEMTVFGISVSEKKALWLKLDVKESLMGHSAAPPELYANKRLVKALIKLLDEKNMIKFNKLSLSMFKEIGKMEGGFRGFIIRHINWDIFRPFVKKYFSEGQILHVFVYNTFVITSISSPTSGTNQIADNASAILDCRLLPETDTEKFKRKIINIVGPKISVSTIMESTGANPSADTTSYFVAMIHALKTVYPNCDVIPVLFPATTDNNYYRSMGIPVYGIIPCVYSVDLLETVHSIDERIPIETLYKGIEVFTQCINLLIQREK